MPKDKKGRWSPKRKAGSSAGGSGEDGLTVRDLEVEEVGSRGHCCKGTLEGELAMAMMVVMAVVKMEAEVEMAITMMVTGRASGGGGGVLDICMAGSDCYKRPLWLASQGSKKGPRGPFVRACHLCVPGGFVPAMGRKEKKEREAEIRPIPLWGNTPAAGWRGWPNWQPEDGCCQRPLFLLGVPRLPRITGSLARIDH